MQTHAQLGISFLSWKYSHSIKHALQAKFQVLTTDRRYLVTGVCSILLLFTEQREVTTTENTIIDDWGRRGAETFCIAPGNFERLKLPQRSHYL